MPKKILVTGFPHTGTSILKSKLGECTNLYECPYEQYNITPNNIRESGDKEFILIKTPVIPIEIRANSLSHSRVVGSEYGDYIIIFVIRNPYNVFTSLSKVGYDPLTKIGPNEGVEYHHSFGEYLAAAKFFIEARDNKYENIYTIRYEDFFPNNYEKLKELMDTIGLKYDDNIFENKSKEYTHWLNVKASNINSNELDYKNRRGEYRTWQINQPFQNMNSEVNIPDELADILKNSNIVEELGYSDPRITG